MVAMNHCSFKKSFDFDRRFQLPRNFLYVGATQSGKTSLFLRSLEHAAKNYNPVPSKIFFLYQCFQPGYLEIKEKLKNQGIPVEFTQAADFAEDDLKEISQSTDGQIIIAIDDSTISSSKSGKLAHLFTVARHYQCSLVLFWHVLFTATPESRIISQNTAYFFLMSSPRMAHQVANFGSQLNLRKVLVAAYADTVQKPYEYVLVDVSVTTPPFLRIRSGVLWQDKVQYVHVPAL